ncbi:MAG: hypothetical protein J1F35_00770 [Erysipelotrichales bacterium]|nr:hypothetical protein [Erysipelotrichales bacterium]
MNLMDYVLEYLLHGFESKSCEFYHVIRENPAPKEVIDYIYNVILPLKVKIQGNDIMPARCLFHQGKFLSWCWETTQTMAPLIQDAYIARGILFFKRRYPVYDPKMIEYFNYNHAWIYFMYDGDEYVFDPCLKIICSRSLYDEVFEVNIIKEIPTIEVKQEMLDTLVSAGICLDKENNIYKVNILGTWSKWNNFYTGDIDYTAKLHDNKILNLEAIYNSHNS